MREIQKRPTEEGTIKRKLRGSGSFRWRSRGESSKPRLERVVVGERLRLGWVDSCHDGPETLRRLDLQVRKSIKALRPGGTARPVL